MSKPEIIFVVICTKPRPSDSRMAKCSTFTSPLRSHPHFQNLSYEKYYSESLTQSVRREISRLDVTTKDEFPFLESSKDNMFTNRLLLPVARPVLRTSSSNYYRFCIESLRSSSSCFFRSLMWALKFYDHFTVFSSYLLYNDNVEHRCKHF